MPRRSQRTSSSNKPENTASVLPQPQSQKRAQVALSDALIRSAKQAHPHQAAVKTIHFGDPATYGIAKRPARVDHRVAPTIQLSQRGGSLYVELWGSKAAVQSEQEQRSSRGSRPAERLASFHFVNDGRYQFSAKVFRIGRKIEIWKYNNESKNGHKWWSFVLQDNNEAQIRAAKKFWDTLCYRMQKMSLSELSYFNMARQVNLEVDTHRYNTRANEALRTWLRSSSDSLQPVLTIRVPDVSKPWQFTRRLASESFLKRYKEVKSGKKAEAAKEAKSRSKKKTTVARTKRRAEAGIIQSREQTEEVEGV